MRTRKEQDEINLGLALAGLAVLGLVMVLVTIIFF